MRVIGAAFLVDFAVFADRDDEVAFASRRIGCRIAGGGNTFASLAGTIAARDERDDAVGADGGILVIQTLLFEGLGIAISAFDDVIEADAGIAVLIVAACCLDDIAVFASDGFVADAFGRLGFVAFFCFGGLYAFTRDATFIGDVAISGMPSAVFAFTGDRCAHACDFTGRAIRWEILAEAAFADIAVVACGESLEAVFAADQNSCLINANGFECFGGARTIGDAIAVVAFGAVLACFQNDFSAAIAFFGFAIFADGNECLCFAFDSGFALAINTGLSAKTWRFLDHAIFAVQARITVIFAAFIIGFALPGANAGIAGHVAFAGKISHKAILACRIGHAVAAEGCECGGIASGRRQADAIAADGAGLTAFANDGAGDAFGQRVLIMASRSVVQVAVQHVDIAADVEIGIADIALIADLGFDIADGAVFLIGRA